MKTKTTKYILPASWASFLVNGDGSGLTLKEINEVERFTSDLPSGTWTTDGESYFRGRNDANELGGEVCDFDFITPDKYGVPSLGCYCDGANGQDHNDRKLIRMALDYGWSGPAADEAKAFLTADDEAGESDDRSDEALDRVEQLQGLTESAEQWLNEQESRPFTYWGWNDGNFGLWANVDGAREDCGFVSRKQVDEETNPEDASYPADDYRGEWLHVSDHGNATLYIREDDKTKPEGFRDVEVWGVV